MKELKLSHLPPHFPIQVTRGSRWSFQRSCRKRRLLSASYARTQLFLVASTFPSILWLMGRDDG